MKLEVLSNIYLQYHMRSPKFSQFLVKDALFERLTKHIYLLRQTLKSDLFHPNIALLDFEIRNLVYVFGTSLVPLANQYDEAYFQQLFARMLSELQAFPEVKPYVHLIVSDLEMLVQQKEHTYETALKQIVNYTSISYTVVSKKRLDSEQQEDLKKKFLNFKLTFKSYLEFTGDLHAYDNVIFIGSANLFGTSLIESINANHFYFICFPPYSTLLKRSEWLVHERIATNQADFQVLEAIVEIPYEFIAPIENIEVTLADLKEPTLPESLIWNVLSDENSDDGVLTECKLIQLEGGEFLFEECGKKAKCDSVTYDFCFERKNVAELQAGEYVILIDFHEWEDRRRLADLHFQNEQIVEHRRRLEKLKKYFQKQIDKFGLEKFTKNLNKKLGLQLKTYQVLGLTRKETFKLKNNQDYLTLLQHIAKTPDVAYRYLESCQKLASYHNRIGRIARNHLRDFLNNNPEIFEEIEQVAQIKIPGMEFLKVELFKVKNISECTYQVPASKVGVPMRFYSEEAI